MRNKITNKGLILSTGARISAETYGKDIKVDWLSLVGTGFEDEVFNPEEIVFISVVWGKGFTINKKYFVPCYGEDEDCLITVQNPEGSAVIGYSSCIWGCIQKV